MTRGTLLSSHSQRGGGTCCPSAPATRPRPGARPWIATAALTAIMLTLTGATCANDAARVTACNVEPTGSILVFFQSPGEGGSRWLDATVTGMRSLDGGFVQVMLRDSSGTADSLKYRGAGEALPITEGRSYEIQVDFFGGAPPASAIVLRDSTGLLFAAATDQTIGGHVLRDGLPEFHLELVESDCPARASDRCYDSITNSILRVSHDGNTRDLRHGQSAGMGSYRVVCLTAQRVEYSDECSDAGLPAVSYAIVRDERSPRADEP